MDKIHGPVNLLIGEGVGDHPVHEAEPGTAAHLPGHQPVRLDSTSVHALIEITMLMMVISDLL